MNDPILWALIAAGAVWYAYPRWIAPLLARPLLPEPTEFERAVGKQFFSDEDRLAYAEWVKAGSFSGEPGRIILYRPLR